MHVLRPVFRLLFAAASELVVVDQKPLQMMLVCRYCCIVLAQVMQRVAFFLPSAWTLDFTVDPVNLPRAPNSLI